MGGHTPVSKMNIWAALIAALLAGAAGALGLGGGGVLIIYLSAFASMDQLKSQGINLLFFIPLAIIAIIIHSKHHLIKWKEIIPICICGLLGAVGGSIVAGMIDASILSKIFAVGIAALGVKELFSKSTADNSSKSKSGTTSEKKSQKNPLEH